MKKDKEQIKKEAEQKEKYLKGIFENFLIDIKESFKQFNFSNLDKNAQNVYFDVKTFIRMPAAYIAEYNTIMLGPSLDDGYTESEKKHAIYHELVHMATTKRKGMLKPKTGFGFIAGMVVAKRVAITEGMTEYITEKITGSEIDIAYLFEKRCAKSLHEIFGDDIIQDFLNADEKSLYMHGEKYGISQKEIKELFNNIDKSLMWRNNSIIDLRDGKKIKNQNQYIYEVEQKLIDFATRVGLENGESKEEILERIDRITANFIKPNLEFNIEDENEEKFLSAYSQDLNKPFEYSAQIKEQIISDKLVSSSQLVTNKSSLKDKIKLMFKIKDNRENVSLPESVIEDKEPFISELKSLSNTNGMCIENTEEKSPKKIVQEREHYGE